ncbi:MAG: hypothetical protein QCI38_01620 [Candidatus Thermoplasmatota archaeon]|nr:hypothetical protein [Candidatus Thermoplasmatota archaeon]
MAKENVGKELQAVAEYAPLFIEELIKVLQSRESEIKMKFDDLKINGEATVKFTLLKKKD